MPSTVEFPEGSSRLFTLFQNQNMYLGDYEITPSLLAAAGGILLLLLWILFWLFRPRRKKSAPQESVLLTMEVPRENDKTPLAAQQLFRSLHGVMQADEKNSLSISCEIQACKSSIRFYVHCPESLQQYVSKQLYAQYPDVKVSKVEDYVRFSDEEVQHKQLVATNITLRQDSYYPIQSFANFDVDPLAGITGSMSDYIEGEELWLQLVIAPAPNHWHDEAIALTSDLREGKRQGKKRNLFLAIVLGLLSFMFITIPKAFFSSGSEEGEAISKKQIVLSEYEKERIKLIEDKARQVGFSTAIRAVALSDSGPRSVHMLNELMASLQQYSISNSNGFHFGARVKKLDEFAQIYAKRQPDPLASILNAEEVASVFHLPSKNVQTPGIVWAKSRKGEPPPNLPFFIEGQDQADLTIFAKTDFRHEERKFGIKELDRLRHIYVIGKTGMGKSTLLSNMAISDVRAGKGVGVIDPHGDLIEDVLDCIPKRRINDVVIFSPSDHDFPVGFNMLEKVDKNHMPLVASGLIAVFYKMFSHSWGPRMEHILRNIILALLEMPNATLMGINRLIIDKKYREKVIDNVTNPSVHDFWKKEFPTLASGNTADIFGPIQNKVGQFLSTSVVRNIVGQENGTINIRQIMDSGKIFLVNLSKGKIGEDVSALFGSMLITKIQLAAMSRADTPEHDRIPFYLYVDEFQNFATESFATILSEARKYKLGLTMANQYIAQMPEEVRNAVFGNVGTLISFGVGANDASYLAKEFNPVFSEDDLIQLDKRHIYLKMAIDGVSSTPFSGGTLPPPANRSKNNEKIISVSRERYGQPAEKVEEFIQTWSGMKARLTQKERDRQLQEQERSGGGGKPPVKNAAAEKANPKSQSQQPPVAPQQSAAQTVSPVVPQQAQFVVQPPQKNTQPTQQQPQNQQRKQPYNPNRSHTHRPNPNRPQQNARPQGQSRPSSFQQRPNSNRPQGQRPNFNGSQNERWQGHDANSSSDQHQQATTSRSQNNKSLS